MYLKSLLLYLTASWCSHFVGARDETQGILAYASGQAYDAGLFTPLGELGMLSETQFTALKHPIFPHHGVRIKKTKFCDGTVDSYTGYIDVEARHLFFYFFESRSDPDRDDVILWTNGGPGASSALGLFMEQGPCRVVDSNTTKFHPESWNSKANMFFIDQPVDVGWSYADYGEHVGTTEEAAKDIAAFIALFFEHFTKFKGRAFHMSGESYGGRYIPVYAAAVYDQNRELVTKGLTPINLNSIMIGNGYTDFYSLMLGYYHMVCTPASLPPVFSIQACIRMRQALPRCEKWVKEACIDMFDRFRCSAATSFCDEELQGPLMTSGLNPYDISVDCDGDLEDNFCYPISNSIVQYLSRPEIRKLIGAEHDMKHNFSAVSWKVNTEFTANMDHYRLTNHYVSNLLDRGVRVLIYVGMNDFACHHVGNERWTTNLDWSGGDGYRNESLRDWYVDGKKAGRVRAYGGLSFVTIDGAGHMVPYDKPVESLELVNRWMAGEDI